MYTEIFFGSKDKHFSEIFDKFIDQLTEKEYHDFNSEYMEIHRQLEAVAKKYNDIVSDRISLNQKSKFLNDAAEYIKKNEDVDYKQILIDSYKYGLINNELLRVLEGKK